MEITGLSISRCIQAILEGKVPEGKVIKIIGGTACGNPEEILALYANDYWERYPVLGRQLFFKLVQTGRIDQPRLRNLPPPDTSNGIWKILDSQMHTEELVEILRLEAQFIRKISEDSSSFFSETQEEDLKKVIANIPEDIETHFLSLPIGKIPDQSLVYTLRQRLEFFFVNHRTDDKATYTHLIMAFLPIIRKHFIVSTRASNIFKAARSPFVSQAK
ncbi:MAG: hypothetical protein HQM09_04305 [Candidatus Riflebacteria bacterium]|nr:hypothetical protein [Candidatus Riflebacteria bacterium]